MDNSIIPARAFVTSEKPDWKFLGGLIDAEDLEGGSFDIYTGMRDYHAFALKKERVGFAGGIGLKTYGYACNKEKHLELVIWPYMPAKDTKRGYMDVFDPDPTLTLIWKFGTYGPHEEITGLKCVEVELKNSSMNASSVSYALKTLARARELWPSDSE